MAFWKYGVFNGLLAGAIWGSIWQLITNIALIVGTGISIDLQIGPALLSGLATGLFVITKKNNNSVIYYLSGVLITLFFLLVFSNGQPLALSFQY